MKNLIAIMVALFSFQALAADIYVLIPSDVIISGVALEDKAISTNKPSDITSDFTLGASCDDFSNYSGQAYCAHFVLTRSKWQNNAQSNYCAMTSATPRGAKLTNWQYQNASCTETLGGQTWTFKKYRVTCDDC